MEFWIMPREFRDVYEELQRARKKHPLNQNSLHGGYAVILEEMDELWEEVRRRKPDPERLWHECVQVAAMAIRFLEDLVPYPEPVFVPEPEDAASTESEP